ncbi:hypothetical protein FRC19_005962 [Serendipita sp. 401]|nr:hypothetical protein FRC19_005962 [Serendipita sp. 401]
MSRPRRVTAPKSYADIVSSDKEEVSDAFEGTESENSDTSADEADLESLPTSYEPSDKFIPLPTPAQIAEAKKFIAEQTNNCASIRAEYAKQKKVLIQIRGRLEASEKLLLERQASISPIRRVPQEVLSMIFLIHTIEHSQSTWTLMHVCRTWRLAALTTPSLWTRIKLITVSRKEKKSKSRLRVSEGYEVCSKSSQLIRALQRVGSAPLDLWILMGYNEWNRDSSLYSDEEMRNLIAVVKRQLLRPRLRSLRIQTAEYFRPDDAFDEFDFRSLKEIEVNRVFPELFKRIAQEVGDLRSLIGPCSEVLSLKDKLSHVEELSIVGEYGSDAQSVQSLLSTSHSLTNLTIHGSNLNKSFKTTMTRLERLELWNVPPVWPIVCPNLTHLTIKPYMESDYEDLYLPHLVYLSYTGSSGKFLTCFNVPALHTLKLKAAGGKGEVTTGMRRVWIKNWNPTINPVVFKLIDSTVNSKILAKVLQEMTNCEELYMIRTMINSDLFNSLLPEKRVTTSKTKKTTKSAQNAKSKETWWIPARKLRMFVGDMNGCKARLNEEDLWMAASNFVAMREAASVPLEEVSLRLDRGGWKDFVKDDIEDRDI